MTSDGLQMELRHDPIHSPTGFEWGYLGSGPADLAYALCREVLGHPPPPPIYQLVKADLVARFRDEWEVTDMAVLDSIARAKEGGPLE